MSNDVFPGATLVQLVEWGYPQGQLRPTPPADKAFSTVHITGNKNLPSADGEIAWRKNDPGLQNSATFFVNRDGSIRQALGDPLHMDPWANGDVRTPDMTNPRIAAVVRDGVNANERTIVAIENVGYEPGASITRTQEAANARIIAYYHAKARVPVNRETVIGHYQLNSVARSNCPGTDKSLIDRIVAAAAPEKDMILVPIELFPAGTIAGFGAGKTFDLYRIRNGAIERAQLKTGPDRGTSAAVGGKVALNGDAAHAGLYILNGVYAGWVVSSYGTQPSVMEPKSADTDLEYALDQANRRTASVKSMAATLLRKGATADRTNAGLLEAAAKNVESL